MKSAIIDLEDFRNKVFELCRVRRWSMLPSSRLGFHVLEAAELTEALKGKKGDEIEEAGDLLFTALAMIPERISLSDVLWRAEIKRQFMLTKPPYMGEERTE